MSLVIVFAGFLFVTWRHLWLNLDKKRWKAGIPLATALSSGIIWVLILITIPPILNYSIDFYWNHRGYSSVVELVRSNQLQPNEKGAIQLPLEYQEMAVYGVKSGKQGDDWVIYFTVDRMGNGYVYSTKPYKCKKVLFAYDWYACSFGIQD